LRKFRKSGTQSAGNVVVCVPPASPLGTIPRKRKQQIIAALHFHTIGGGGKGSHFARMGAVARCRENLLPDRIFAVLWPT
jgi:hypothetical protein